jgi:hypothetical protein
MTRELPPPPRVTGVVARSGDYEAIVSSSQITLGKVGPRHGRTALFSLTLDEATQVLDLIAHGRKTLTQLDGQP